MLKPYYYLKLVTCLLWISARPKATAAGLAIADCMYHLGLITPEVERLKKDAETDASIRSRALLPRIDLEALNELPANTLGKEYSERMIRDNLKPDFYKPLEIR